MDNNIAIEFKNVSKIYKLKRKDKNVKKEEKTQYFYALKDISFEIKKGQIVKKVPEDQLLDVLREELLHWNK